MTSHTKADVLKHHDESNKAALGFWIYLMTDCLLFASLFATYAVLRNNTNGGPGGGEIFSLPYVLIETLLLLTSSFTCALAMLALHERNKKLVLIFLALTFALGAGFLGMELREFANLYAEGNSWMRSGSLSAFFTLIGTHGAHITIGLLWISVLGVRIAKHGLTVSHTKRLMIFSLFWHFLDVIWIFIYTFVYLVGVL